MTEFRTPPIPKWIMKIEHPLYTNVFSFKLRQRNLWGTETLLGDWSGRYLLIAKDFYPSSYVAEAIERGIKSPYSHKPEAPTNRNLVKTLKHFGFLSPAANNTDCGFLYISACFLLRNDGLVRGPLPAGDEALNLSAPVVRHTIDNMPNLQTVVTMGDDAHKALLAGGFQNVFKSRRISHQCVSHPSRALSDSDRFAEWAAVFSRRRSRE